MAIDITKRFGSFEDLSADAMRENYLKDIKLVDRDGEPWGDEIFETALRTAVAEFERETKLKVLPYEVEDEQHDYYLEDYINFAWMQLNHWPVLSVEKVSVIYPTGQKAIEFPKEWVKLYKEHGQFTLVPTQGTLSQVLIGQGGSYLPLIYGGLPKLPNMWHIDYTAGFGDDELPWDVIDCIMKLAVINVLTVAADSVLPPGVTSLSVGVDGVSQSTGFMNNGQLPPVFSGRIKLYRAELYGGQGVGDIGQQGKLASIRDQYQGIRMVVA